MEDKASRLPVLLDLMLDLMFKETEESALPGVVVHANPVHGNRRIAEKAGG